MADIPVPRSYSQIVGAMVDALLARLGLPSLKVGSPALSIIEAAAQSDLRSSQDIFNLLNSLSLDRAEGQALDRIGSDEQVARMAQSPSSGALTITDTNFSKISTRVYQGGGAPIVGTLTLAVEDANAFTATGSVYIGRGTTNYEGPLAYTAKTNAGSYWTLTLTTGTTKFHNLGESVVLAQGGSRTIPIGTLARTPQGNAGAAIQFATTFQATIPDGETSVSDVPAKARVPGSIGNAVRNSVTEFVSAPFGGATVTNTNPFSNGRDTEDDQTYRERIRSVRQSRTKGTALAIQTGVVGLTALDENNRILSASLVTRENEPVTLFIDDGTGYEEKTEGIAFENLAESSVGGERYFQLANGRPVAKAFLESSLSAPFTLEADCVLAVEVGGVRTTHAFPAEDFRSIANASAFEIVASINSDASLDWSARMAEGGTKFSLFAKADTNEYLQIVSPDSGFINANEFLGLPVEVAKSLWLYRDDRLLNKDGSPAILDTKPQALWASITSGDKLEMEVDGVPLYDATGLGIAISDQDFVDAGTQYVSVDESNSLAAWADVLNFKIPGITVTVNGGGLTVTSNAGRSARAHLTVTGGAIGSALFQDVEAEGADQDYTMDRNLGQIKLIDALEAGSRLTAGSLATRGFLETPSFTAHTITDEETSVAGQTGAELWFVIDGSASLISTSVGAGTLVTVTNPTTSAAIRRVRYNSGTATDLFGNVQVGDWLIATDLALDVANRGAYRIVRVDGGGTWVEIEQDLTWASAQGSTALTTGGIRVARTTAVPQRVYIVDGANYTALSLSEAMASQLNGGTAVVYRTTRVRARTNTFTGGDIALVATNTEGLALGFPLADEVSGISHLANIEAGHPQTGTPNFVAYETQLVVDQTDIDYFFGTAPSSGDILVGGRSLPDTDGVRWGNQNFVSPLEIQTGTVLTLRETPVRQWLGDQRFYLTSPYALTARDQLGITVDGDLVQKRYVMNMYRKVTPTSGTYGITNTFTDADNGNISLAEAFGVGFDWQDFAVHMKARQKAGGVLWRYYRHGPEGNRARVGYVYPEAADQTVGLTVDSRTSNFTDISIQLASGSARSIGELRNTSYLAKACVSGPDADLLYQYVYVLDLVVASGSREVRLYYNTGIGSLSGTVTGGTSTATATVVADSGTYVTLTGITGTFLAAEALIFSGGGTASSAGNQQGYTTFTLTLPGGVTDHGLQVADQFWRQSTDVNFSSGPRTVTARTASTITFHDFPATPIGSISGIISVSRDLAGRVSLSGASALTGDIWHISTSTLDAQTIKTQSLADDFVTGNSPDVATPSTVLSWFPLEDSDNLQIYPLNAAMNATDQIISTVGAITRTPITGFEYSAGTITDATYEAPAAGLGANNGGAGPWYYLVDGINWVRSTNTPALPANDFDFTFKDAVDAGLATDSDWANEDVRLVPATAVNVAGFLDVAAVGGLFSASEIVVATRASEPQITTITAGSDGSVEATGGAANATTAAAVGNAVVAGATSVVAIPTSESDGLRGQAWAAINNTIVAPKAIFDSTTALTSFGSGGTVTVTSTPVWKYSSSGGSTHTFNKSWLVEKQGDFVAFIYAETDLSTPANFSNVLEGDWVAIDPYQLDPDSFVSVGTMSTLNRGVFRVVRTDTTNGVYTFWIENSRAIEELATVSVLFLDYDSVMPGDKLIVNTSLWGASNLGTWTVAGIVDGDQFSFKLDTTTRTPIAASAAALGTSAGLVQVYEANPSRLIKRIVGIAPNGTLTDVKFDTTAGYRAVSASYGSILRPLDKLAFGIASDGSSLPVVPGIDGYSHYTGLIAEANRTVYGDEAQSSTYPGIAAAGANININGPLVRRVQVSFALRVKTGISTVDIADKVRSAVASTINQTGVGQPIAISALIAAAESVNGVVAVTVLSPTYGTGHDIISVQPYEKPLVVDTGADVQISFVGE